MASAHTSQDKLGQAQTSQDKSGQVKTRIWLFVWEPRTAFPSKRQLNRLEVVIWIQRFWFFSTSSAFTKRRLLTMQNYTVQVIVVSYLKLCAHF